MRRSRVRFCAAHIRPLHPALRSWVVLACLLMLAGCAGPQSALDPAGRGAEHVARLFWWLVTGAAFVWFGVIGLTIYVLRLRPGPHNPRTASALIIGGGAVFPTVVLAGYLIYGLSLMPDLLAPAPEGSLKIAVTGERFWWRVRYLTPEGEGIELANEIRLPVGERVQLFLNSPDVIHSFWVPSIAGKIDMVPGRINTLALEPTRTGIFRGSCAEFCGDSHALMNFYVVVQEQEDFARWLAHQAESAQAPTSALARRGRDLFLSNGCGACHTIRGTPADGKVGPDLTHVGSRLSLAAGTLPNESDDFLEWIAKTEEIKPEVHMPAFGMLPQEDLQALAVYLDGLE